MGRIGIHLQAHAINTNYQHCILEVTRFNRKRTGHTFLLTAHVIT